MKIIDQIILSNYFSILVTDKFEYTIRWFHIHYTQENVQRTFTVRKTCVIHTLQNVR